MRIASVKINGMREPVGYAFDTVRVSWRVEDAAASNRRAAEYAALMREPDFAAASQYQSTQHGEPKYNALAGMYTDTGFRDVKYDYINGNETARDVAGANEQLLGISEAGIGSDRLQRMTPDEIAIYNYLYSKRDELGEEAANEFLKFIATDPNYSEGSLNAREREYEEQRMAEYAKEDPVGTSIASVMLSPLRGVAYVGQAADYLEDGKIDQNAGYNRYSYLNTATRNAVSKKIEESGKWGSVGSFLYNTGMSMGDFLVQGALFGGVSENLSLAIMGTGAAADETIKRKDQGLSDGQAFALGTIAGFAEIVTEKVSLDALLGEAAKGRGALAYLLTNAAAEGSEEGASDLINWAADVIVAGDKGEWRTAVRQYKEQGMSESEAFGHALADKAAEIGLDVLGGALSGGVMAAPGTVFRAVNNRRTRAAERAAEVQQEAPEAASELVPVSEQAVSRLATGKNNIIARTKDDIVAFVRNALRKKGGSERLYMGTIPDSAARTVMESTGINVTSYNAILQGSVVQHIFNHHGNERTEASRGQRAVTPDDFALISQVLAAPDAVTLSPDTDAYGRQVLIFEKQIGDNIVTAQAVTDGRHALATNSMWIQKKKEPTDTTPNAGNASAPGENVRNVPPSGSFNDSISQAARDVNTELSRPAAVQAYDTARMVRAGAALGESGEKALNASYDPAVPADRYYRGFSEYYEAGVQGRSESDVKQDAFTSALNSAQRYAAYSAGRNDAAASLAREERAKNFAKTAGGDSGLVFDDYVSRELDETTANRINAVAKRLGTRVRFTEPGSIRGGTANAAISGAEVLIEKNNPNPVMFLLGHEWTHRLQELAPQEYRKFRQAAANVEDVRLNAERAMELYRRQGVELTYEEALDEAAADYAGQMLDEDGAVLDRFIAEHKDDRTLLQRVRDAIRSLINRLTGRERRGAESAVRKLDEALRAAERQAARLSENSGNAREGGTKYAIKYDRNNTPYVVIEEDILAGVPRSKWVKTVKDNLRKKFPNGVVVGNNVIQIDRKSRGEMTFSRYMQRLMHTEPEMYADKLRSTNNADEILRAARNWTNEALLHPRRDTIIDFARGEVLIRVGKRDYSAQVIVGNQKGKGLLLYDIIGLTRTTIEEKRTSATYTDVDPERSHGRQAALAHGNSIPDDGEDVNRKFSMKGTETNRETAELERENAIFVDRAQYSFEDDGNPYEGRSMTEESEIYSYDFLTSLPDMQTVMLPDVDAVRDKNGMVDKRAVVDMGMKNARSVGTERGGNVFVRNSYTGRTHRIDRESIRHGLNGLQNRFLTNARLGAVIGEVVKNAVPINALHNKAAGVTGTYAMAGYATDSSGREFVAIVTVEQRSGDISGVEVYDVTHAVSGRQKRSERADTKSQGVYPSTNASMVSIADLLEIVKSTHQSILSEDVLAALGETRNPAGYYSDKVRYSISEDSEEHSRAALERENARLRERQILLRRHPRERRRVQGYDHILRGRGPQRHYRLCKDA